MKLKNVKVCEQYIIKSLKHTNVGALPFDIDDVVFVRDKRPKNTNTVLIDGGWGIHHKDLKRVDSDCSPVEYTNPLQEYLGKEVEVVGVCDARLEAGVRGFVVSLSNRTDNLLIDFGVGFRGHKGSVTGVHPQKNETCWFLGVDKLKFLTEDDE